jgi:uncharacterized protein YceH (UPF0502 family)
VTLEAVEGRVLGALLEKERTTPDQYPLTLSGLVAACNQMTSREPVMQLTGDDVELAATALKSRGLVRFVHPSHGRSVLRYRHALDERTGWERDQLAVVALLLLRGPQTSAELRSRAERLHEFTSVHEVETVLEGLRASTAVAELGGGPVVQRVAPGPGQKEGRWQQLLAGEVERAARPAPVAAVGLADRVAELEARIARIEEALGDLLGS